MKIIWTRYAVVSLSEIYKYYKLNASNNIANKIRDSLLYSVKHLEEYPFLGPIEEFLIELNEEHRYLSRGNYKIIYKILNSKIYITDIFDTRQNPDKLKIRNK